MPKAQPESFQQEIRSKLIKIGTTIFILLAGGVAGYSLIEGWSLFDGLYMTVITLATVGYAETHELSTAGRAFTIALIFSGIGVLAWTLSSLTALIIEGELTGALRRRRMNKAIDSLQDHYILCGVSHAGRAIIEELTKTQRPFVVIDRDPAVCRELSAGGVLSISGDATYDAVLQQAGIERARGLFATLGSDRDNAFVALTARGLNPRIRIVSEEVESEVRPKLIRSGASAVVNPNLIGGLRMASEMVRPAVVGFLDHMLHGDGDAIRFEEVEITPHSKCIGQPLGAIKGAEGRSALVVSLRLANGSYELNPPVDRPIRAGETLVVIGTVSQLAALRHRVGEG
jgi:voltage-gated potassium channel